ncbi:MAG: glycosyltransferase family 39 protein [Pseudomonadota bacterium]|nr:glycosyltransferase family 39 protein [Pseudomonadota bacterium]
MGARAQGAGVVPGNGWRWAPALLILLVSAALLGLAASIGTRPLSMPEEGRYVGVAWEMVRSGDWLVPTENGLPFLHKPPLFYWLTAAMLSLFGSVPAAARLAPLLGALGGGLAMALLTRRWLGAAAARWVGVVLLTMPAFFAVAQFANLDILVAGCMAATIALAAHAVLLQQHGAAWHRVVVAVWVAAALGVLAKGLIGLLLPGLIVAVWLLATRQPRAIVRLLSPWGVAAFAVVALPWFFAIQGRFPGFAHYFVVYQHFERFTAGGFNNVRPWWFYLVLVPLLSLPWSLWLIRRPRATPAEPDRHSAERAPLDVGQQLQWLFWIWIGVVLLFFSLPASKPLGYAAPLLFPIAALAAQAIVRRCDKAGSDRWAMASAVVGLLLCLGAVFAASRFDRRGNDDVAAALRQHRSAGEPVVMVGEYFFDLPVLAGLRRPVPVVGRWQDPRIAAFDNWQRELSEDASFAPQKAATLLVGSLTAALPCGSATAWAVVRSGDEAYLKEAATAERVFSAASGRSALWRVSARSCTSAAPLEAAP